jgi:protein TonB
MIIKVHGMVQLDTTEGKPVIILERREQVTIESSLMLPLDATPDGMEGGVERGSAGGVGGDLTGAGTGSVKGHDSAARPLKITRPRYPQEARAKNIEGTVVVEILIDSSGRVVRARVIQSVPLLDAAALECVYQWEFKPAVKNGRSVPTIAHAPVAFRIY